MNVLRCHNCYAYGHMMKECRMKEKVCLRYRDCGHLSKDCKGSERCRNCARGLRCDHRFCPEYRKMLEREKAKIESE